MKESFHGVTRKDFHKAVDTVLDSRRAQTIKAMVLTIPLYVKCVKTAEKKERLQKATAHIKERKPRVTRSTTR